MTVCIGAICNTKNGGDEPKVILIGDRMITGNQLSIEFEHPNPKLNKLTNYCAFATAGNALAHTEIDSAVRDKIDHLKSPSVKTIANCIKEAYVELRRAKIEDLILKPRGIDDFETYFKLQSHGGIQPEILMNIQNRIDTFNYNLEILVCGVDYDGAHVYGIYNPGCVAPYDSIGYLAIGSGEPHATTTFISHNYCGACLFEEALYTAYKAKKTAQNAPGVGANFTDIWVISREKVEPMGDDVWKELERYYKAEIKSKTNFDELKKRVGANERKEG